MNFLVAKVKFHQNKGHFYFYQIQKPDFNSSFLLRVPSGAMAMLRSLYLSRVAATALTKLLCLLWSTGIPPSQRKIKTIGPWEQWVFGKWISASIAECQVRMPNGKSQLEVGNDHKMTRRGKWLICPVSLKPHHLKKPLTDLGNMVLILTLNPLGKIVLMF